MNVIGRAVSMGDFKDLEYRTAALDSIDSALIQRVATSVFQDNNLTVVHVSPAKSRAPRDRTDLILYSF